MCVKDDQIRRGEVACSPWVKESVSLNSSLRPLGSAHRQRCQDCLVSLAGRTSSLICRAQGKINTGIKNFNMATAGP